MRLLRSMFDLWCGTEGVTQTQHRHARDNESVESFGTAARQAMLEGHVSPMNIHVLPQLAFHVAVNDDPHSQACAGACGVDRTPSTTPSTSSSHDSSSASPDLRRAVTVEGDRAVFSRIMQIAPSAVRDLWTAEGVTSVDDLACLYTGPRQVCHPVQRWTTARKWISSWRRYNTRGRKRGAEHPPTPAENGQVFNSRRFGQVRENGVPRSSDSPVPTQATTVVNEPGFHPSSPAVLQRLVSVIVAMGPYSSFADEVSDCSELTTQLLQRRFQHFSDGNVRVAQLASLGGEALSAFSPMEPVGQPALRIPHRRRQAWPNGGKRHLDAVGLGQTRDGWSLPYRLFAPCIVQATRGRASADTR